MAVIAKAMFLYIMLIWVTLMLPLMIIVTPTGKRPWVHNDVDDDQRQRRPTVVVAHGLPQLERRRRRRREEGEDDDHERHPQIQLPPRTAEEEPLVGPQSSDG